MFDLVSRWYAKFPPDVLQTPCWHCLGRGTRQVSALWLMMQLTQFCYCENQRGLSSPEQQAVVAARVNGHPILLREVVWQIRRIRGQQPASPGGFKQMEAEVLQQLIQRYLVQLYLEEKKLAASQQEVAVAVESLKSRLREQNLTLLKHLERQRLTETELRASLAWRIGWQRYLDLHLTEANLKQYFTKHVRDFDGTKMRVAHILFKCSANAPVEQQVLLRERAVQLARRIREGELSFAEAARRYSEAPTARQGGNLGLIQRNEPMPDAFTRVAFALQSGQVGGPVRTQFGIHLIQCLEIEPGQREWSDMRPQVRVAVTRYLFGWAADQQARTARVVWTGVVPRREPPAGTDGNRPEATKSKE